MNWVCGAPGTTGPRKASSTLHQVASNWQGQSVISSLRTRSRSDHQGDQVDVEARRVGKPAREIRGADRFIG